MNNIRYIGYSAIHSGDFAYDYSQGNCYLLVLTATPAEFMIDDVFVQYPANTAILYAPGQKVNYRACLDSYQNDWIRFYSDEIPITQFPLTGRPFPVSDADYCHHLIKLLTWETSLSSPDSELIISHLLHALFLKLRTDIISYQEIPHAAEMTILRRQIYSSPQKDWKIEEIAKDMHLSSGYFQILYKKLFHTTCIDDIIDGRIRLAKEALRYSGASTQEVSELCGYHNVEHFCRQFKKRTQMTPGAYRKNHNTAPVKKDIQLKTVVGTILESD